MSAHWHLEGEPCPDTEPLASHPTELSEFLFNDIWHVKVYINPTLHSGIDQFSKLFLLGLFFLVLREIIPIAGQWEQEPFIITSFVPSAFVAVVVVH